MHLKPEVDNQKMVDLMIKNKKKQLMQKDLGIKSEIKLKKEIDQWMAKIPLKQKYAKKKITFKNKTKVSFLNRKS